MLNIEPIDTAAFAEYLLKSVMLLERDKKRTDYYYKDDASLIPFENSFRIVGEGAKEFGVHGVDFSKGKEEKAIFLNLFHGIDPMDGKTKLVENANLKKDKLTEEDKKKFRKVGYDCCFSSNKPMSIAVMYARSINDKELEMKLVNIHRQAVAYALGEMEKNLTARSGAQGCVKEKNVKGFMMQVDHFDTRPTILHDENGKVILGEDGKPKTVTDPQLHTHTILANYGICEDGKVRALDGLSVVRQIHLGTALFRQKEAELLQQMGLKIVSHRQEDDYGQIKTMDFDMIGVSEEAKTEFSHRRSDIYEYMDEFGVSAQEAVLATRSDKELDYNLLEEEWRERMDTLTAKDRKWIDLEPNKFENQLDEVISDEAMLDLCQHLKHRVAITETDLRTTIAQCLTGHDNAIERTQETLERILNDEDLICSLKDPDELGNPQFCSMKIVQADLHIREYVMAKENSREHNLEPEAVAKAMAAFEAEKAAELKAPIKLSKEQRNAIKVATSSDLTVIAGRAGTGKSWSSRVIADSYKEAGYKVTAVSVANMASLNLQEEALIEGASAAKILYDYEAGKIKFTSKDVILFDEAGMTDILLLEKFVAIAEETGASLKLIGDTQQLSSVGCGNGLKIIEQCVNPKNMATLKDIQRQKEQKDRDIANEFYNMKTKEDSLRQYAALEKYGYVGITTNNDEAFKKIAQEYVDHPKPFKDKLVMASTNESVQQLNKAIQAKYIANGKIGKDPIRKIGVYRFHEGSPVRFTNSKRFDKDTKVINGTTGFVIPSQDGTLRVQLEDGKIVDIPEDFKSLHLNYATTINRAQGQSVEEKVWVAVDTSSFKSSLSLVSFTRAKRDIKFYGAEEEMEAMSRQMHLIDIESDAFLHLSEESRINALRKKGLTPFKIKENVKAASVAKLKKFLKDDTKKEIVLTSLSAKSRKHLREKWQLTFRKQLKNNQSLTIHSLQQETTEEHAMHNHEVDTEIQEALTLNTNPAPELINKKKLAEQGPFPWTPNTNYKFLNPVLEHYDLSVKALEDGNYDILFNKSPSVHIKKDRSIQFAEKALVQHHVYDIATQLAKSNHFDPSKPINISVSEKLANFSEAKQADAIRKMIEALQKGGIDIDMITISNEKHRKLLEEYRLTKAEDAITLDQTATTTPEATTQATMSADDLEDAMAQDQQRELEEAAKKRGQTVEEYLAEQDEMESRVDQLAEEKYQRDIENQEADFNREQDEMERESNIPETNDADPYEDLERASHEEVSELDRLKEVARQKAFVAVSTQSQEDAMAAIEAMAAVNAMEREQAMNTRENATDAVASTDGRSPIQSVEDAKAEARLKDEVASLYPSRGGMEGLDVNKATKTMQKTQANRPRKTVEQLQAEQDAKDLENARRLLANRTREGQTYTEAPASQEEVKARKKNKLGM